ncbi:MAG: exo-alpha-sialidase, partial [Armatimonadetes bacterium]|nr:exo-alpha-sialidase [Armatimonadota bacterium]
VRADCGNFGYEPWHQAAILTETGMAETDDNVVVGLSRPMLSPFMWQIQSNDGGQSWEPAAYAAFPGYCISLTSTASGALLAVTRYPYLTAYVSWDGGRNWDKGTILDYAAWANHSAVEVEPGVVLVIYMGDIIRPGQADTRILRLRPTLEGLKIEL